ncbi:MAG: hypothetical protein FJZ92_06205 [Chloroflexi bacterium]|nr:hypothetical protein [Chloroflexota bacterium]
MVLKQISRLHRPLIAVAAGAVLSAAAFLGAQVAVQQHVPDAAYAPAYEAAAQQAVSERAAAGEATLINYKTGGYDGSGYSPAPGIQSLAITWD